MAHPLSERIAGLSPEKQALLERKLRNHFGRVAGDDEIPRRRQSGPCLASFAQQRLWFLDQLEPGSVSYNTVQAWRLRGTFDPDSFRAAFVALVGRHEILRTRFLTIDGQAYQSVASVAEAEPIPFTIIDAQEAPPDTRDAQAKSTAAAEAAMPFDLSSGPLFRAKFVRFAPDDGLLILSVHHIITDRSSRGIMERELAAFYRAAIAGEPLELPELPELPIQYADFAVRQRECLQGEVLEKQLGYWRKQLGGEIPRLELSTERLTPAVRGRRGGRVTQSISRALRDDLTALGRREHATLFMVLLAGLQALLHRYTGQDDIVVGSPVAGRTHSELDNLIGFFINALVLRSNLSDNPRFREFLGRVRETALEAYDHQDIPFEKLVEELQPERSPGNMPFFNVALTLQNMSTQAFALPNLHIEPVEVDVESPKFDLSLLIDEIPDGGLLCSLEYDADLFERETMKQWLEHFVTLLTGIVGNPERRISELPLLTESERRRILVEWNAVRTEYPRDRCIHDLFEEQVRRTPSALAVSSGDTALTYDELNQRADRLARRLRALGVGADVPVGICLERSPEMIVGILGILKAGGAYVPLDPSYPAERSAYMLADTAAPVVLTQESLRAQLSSPELGASPNTICLDTDLQWISQEPPTEERSSANPASLAYVMYTSGSTGKPKGVMIPHRAVNRLVVNTNYMQLGSSDVVAQVANFSFDAATFEMWGALLNGARLTIIPKEVVLSPDAFAETLRREGVSAMFLTSALFNHIARARCDAFAGLTYLIVGGDVVDPKSAKTVLESRAPKKLLNGYGPTEATTFACTYEIRRVTDETRSFPIGQPIANTETYVLDRYRNPVPVGVVGELYIGGPGLARGYLNAPALTAEKFVPHPFTGDNQARLYKTGDLARYLPDGNIEFLGRRDHQVKIRGFRIELSEIEAALGRHPSIGESLVTAHGEILSERSLVAYVVPANGQEVTPAELRAFLSAELPDYMLPSAFMILNALPLTPNGKVDRRALPDPKACLSTTNTGFAPPNSALEMQLTILWEELLGISPIGIDESFFNVGGHSLLAVKMIERIEELTGTRLPLRMLFEHATIRALAEALRTRGTSLSSRRYIALSKEGTSPPLFLLHGYLLSGGLYTIGLSRCLGAEQPIYAIHPHDEEIPPSIEAMAADNLQILRSAQPHGPYHLAGFCNGAHVAFEMARQLQAAGEEVPFLGIFTTRAPYRTSFLRDMVHAFARARKLSYTEEIEEYVRASYRWRMLRSSQSTTLRIASKLFSKLSTKKQDTTQEVTEPAPAQDARLIRYIDIISRYHPGRFKGQITLLWGKDVEREPEDPTMGWRHFATSVAIHLMPGGTNTSLTDHPDVVAALLREGLAKATAAPSHANPAATGDLDKSPKSPDFGGSSRSSDGSANNLSRCPTDRNDKL